LWLDEGICMAAHLQKSMVIDVRLVDTGSDRTVVFVQKGYHVSISALRGGLRSWRWLHSSCCRGLVALISGRAASLSGRHGVGGVLAGDLPNVAGGWFRRV
jgi:hypothetical protein